MNRRNLLTSVSTAAVGGALLTTAPGTPAAERALTLRGQYLDRPDGTALYVKDSGSGRTLFLVHSAGVSSNIWSYQMAHLVRQGYRCVAFDRRGHGRSIAPGAGYDYDTLADDMGALLNALDLRRCRARRPDPALLASVAGQSGRHTKAYFESLRA